ncbi:MAG TPA: C-GCAxxG-C-C family protein [Pseudothermotoga sp.]|nr:C-GCAxxG-C-C family protein [Pseudothermotoga sp.]HOK82931.1 C-GCAxxG-C-C family protein [Pseudothermotoga sp.]HPP69895.1 C-GCAxxG-C-C family protein [Pseudothermotoga sp.]
MNRRALELFEKGFSCAQSVFAAYSPIFGVDEKTALRISCAFGGGMARLASVCGVISGAFMVIGLKGGGDDKERTYALAREFVDRFKAVNRSILCKDLLGYDISTVEGLQKARQDNAFKTVCTKYVEDSCRILEELLGTKMQRCGV